MISSGSYDKFDGFLDLPLELRSLVVDHLCPEDVDSMILTHTSAAALFKKYIALLWRKTNNDGLVMEICWVDKTNNSPISSQLSVWSRRKVDSEEIYLIGGVTSDTVDVNISCTRQPWDGVFEIFLTTAAGTRNIIIPPTAGPNGRVVMRLIQ